MIHYAITCMVTVIVGLIAWQLFGYLLLGGLYIIVRFWKMLLALAVCLVLSFICLIYNDSQTAACYNAEQEKLQRAEEEAQRAYDLDHPHLTHEESVLARRGVMTPDPTPFTTSEPLEMQNKPLEDFKAITH